MNTRAERRRSASRAEQSLAARQFRAPATIANTARNARAEIDRHAPGLPLATRCGNCCNDTSITARGSLSWAPEIVTTCRLAESSSTRGR
jgi:hypothetical protein